MGISQTNDKIKHLKIFALAVLLAMISMPFFGVPVRAAAVDLALLPSLQSLKPGDTFNLSIQVQCHGQEVVGIAAFLDFNPADLTLLSIEPGTALETVLQNGYDNSLGVIDFSAGKLPPPYPSADFTLATLEFKVNPQIASPTTAINFHSSAPRKTQVDYLGADMTGQVTGATVNILNLPPATTTSPQSPASNAQPPSSTAGLALDGLFSPVALSIDRDGRIQTAADLLSSDQGFRLTIAAHTKLLDRQGRPLGSFTARVMNSAPKAPPGSVMISAYDLGPQGATFDPALTLTVNYSPATLPAAVDQSQLFLAQLVGQEWQNLNGIIDIPAKTVTASVSHFSSYALLGTLEPTVDSLPTATPGSSSETATPPNSPPAPSRPPAVPTPETKPGNNPDSNLTSPSASFVAPPLETTPLSSPQSSTPSPLSLQTAHIRWSLILGAIAGVLAILVIALILVRKK